METGRHNALLLLVVVVVLLLLLLPLHVLTSADARRYRMDAAPFAPMTAISAVGHA